MTTTNKTDFLCSKTCKVGTGRTETSFLAPLTFSALENGNTVKGIKIRGYRVYSNCIAGAGGNIRKPELQKCFQHGEKVGPGVPSEEGYFERENAEM
jgi:hypothetical protein